MYLLTYHCFSFKSPPSCFFHTLVSSGRRKIKKPNDKYVKAARFSLGVVTSGFPYQCSLLLGLGISPWPRFSALANTKKEGKPIRAQRYTGFTHSSRECSSSPAGSLGEENLRGESPDPAALQPLVWTWEQVLPLFWNFEIKGGFLWKGIFSLFTCKSF